jgi:hypothetical protein
MPGPNNSKLAIISGLIIQRRFALAVAVTFLVAGLAVWAMAPSQAEDRRPLALMTTLPIYWGEAAGMDELIAGTAEPHWARGALEREYELIPLDSLAGADGLAREGGASQGGIKHLLLAQPRALSGPENVALDDWVRGGGRLLLFADPMLTSHSQFSIGDRRRPQDVIFLSPILSRWGLSLQFDEDQGMGERVEMLGDTALPVDLAGRFTIAETAPDAAAKCALLASGIAADCVIGAGRALIIADAALLDQESFGSSRENTLKSLTIRAFSAR